jgi:uncharacterized membrane protein
MYEYAVFWDWLSFAIRWLHVITGIAWIGSSFYFIALDLGLRKRPDLPAGVHGEEWQVHGGGFYHIQKYMVAPDTLPEHLTWFKWESYATWLSGFVLMVIIYYFGADLYLVDPAVLDIAPVTAIVISLLSIGIGWIAYDLLCKSPLGGNNTWLMILLYAVLVAMAWGYSQLFTGRAALLHLGAFTATIMSANVFFIIIPNQKIVVSRLKANKTPDPALGLQAKQRSTHNNYLTLPVLFLMLSNHYPLAFATQYNWLIASLIFLIGVLIRHYFNEKHAGTSDPSWTWLASGVLFMIIIWLSSIPPAAQDARQGEEGSLTDRSAQFASASAFPKIRNTVQGRCAMCHAREPFWDGIIAAPKGVYLETDADIASHAREIYLQAGRSHAMPPANITAMPPAERAAIIRWYEQTIQERL